MTSRSPVVRHTLIDLAHGETVEVVLVCCSCPAGSVCSDGDAFAAACPRRSDLYLVMRGTADGPRYVRRLLPDPAAADWTADRSLALRFRHMTEADDVQRCIVARDGGSAAVVPETANDRAIASLNRRAEW